MNLISRQLVLVQKSIYTISLKVTLIRLSLISDPSTIESMLSAIQSFLGMKVPGQTKVLAKYHAVRLLQRRGRLLRE